MAIDLAGGPHVAYGNVGDSTQKPTRPARDVVLLTALALGYRLAFLIAMPRVVDSADAIHYIGVANTFASGSFRGFDLSIPILYPALCALARLVVHDTETACRVVSLVASTALPAAVYLLVRAMHGRTVALLAGLTVSIWPWLADYGCRIAPEALATTLWFLSVYALARGLREGKWWVAAAALLFFTLHLARPEGTFLLLAAPVGGVILCAGGPHKRNLLRLIPIVAISAVLLAGYVVFMREATGLAALNPRMRVPTDTLRHVFILRGEETLRTALSTWSETLPIMLGPYLLLFAGLGMFGASDRPRDVRLELVVAFYGLVQWGAAIASTYPEPRYLMPTVVAVSLWSARGLVMAADAARALDRGRWLRHAPVGGLIAMMLAGTLVTVLPEHLGRVPRMPREYKRAGLWMKENLAKGLVLTRKPQVGFYADMPTTGPAIEDTVSDAVARARRVGARYLVVDERYTATMVPGLAPLLDPANAPPGLRMVREDLSPYPEARIVVYEVVGSEDEEQHPAP